jgi:hypothetical protein
MDRYYLVRSDAVFHWDRHVIQWTTEANWNISVILNYLVTVTFAVLTVANVQSTFLWVIKQYSSESDVSEEHIASIFNVEE